MEFFTPSNRFIIEATCFPNTSSSSNCTCVCLSALLSSLSARLSSSLAKFLLIKSSSFWFLRLLLGGGWTDELLDDGWTNGGIDELRLVLPVEGSFKIIWHKIKWKNNYHVAYNKTNDCLEVDDFASCIQVANAGVAVLILIALISLAT